MSSLVQQSISGCTRAALVPPLAAPLVYTITSASSFSVFDLFFSIPIGAALGLLILTVAGFPVLALLGYLRLNRVWLVALIGLIVGAVLGMSAPVPVWSVVFSYALVGALTGGVASHFARPNTSFKWDALKRAP